MKKLLSLFAVFALLLVGCGNSDDSAKKEETKTEHHGEWSYEGETGPEYWGELSTDFATCGTGTEQSPIDIESTSTTAATNSLEFNYNVSDFEIEDTGHSVEFLANEDAQNTLTYNGVEFDLVQIHFHNESENTVDGMHYPLEGHLVHKNAAGELLVVAVMFNVDGENAVIADNFTKVGEETSFNAMDLLSDTSSFYTFAGSLTTPPCSEGVQWVVLKTAATISQDQLDQFNMYYTDNNRPVQSLNERTVESN